MDYQCEYGHDDCLNKEEKCHLCTNSFHYRPAPQKKNYALKKNVKQNTKRQGSISEVKNHNSNKQMLNAVSSGTPNSGAGKIKGDEQITGIIRVMEELKTTTKKNLNKQPGKESFTIQKSWLDKLEVESKAEKMEFGYLKFSFQECDDQFYIVVNSSVIMDMIATIVHDRQELKKIESKVAVAEKSRNVIEAENVLLKAKIDLLEEQLKSR